MADHIVQSVKSKYASVAKSRLSSEHAGVHAVARAFGYTPEELAAIPAGANMGLSCGNPIAFASLRPGETVVDLGSGGGLDVFLAAGKVGPMGKAIGIDMTAEMIERARNNARHAEQAYDNVEFHLAPIDHMPLPDGSVDCVISNCVLNLVPDKPAAFAEIFRILKPGGRLAVSDIALKKPLPGELARNILAYVGCIAGAIQIEEYERGLRDAGFQAIQIVDSKKDLRAYAMVEGQSGCCSPAKTSSETLPVASSCCGSKEADQAATDFHQDLGELLRKYDVNEYAASVQVYALKP
jgi:SAM-dependent methyltransferase